MSQNKESLRQKLRQMADEHNAKVNLANQRLYNAEEKLIQRPDFAEVVPLMSDAAYHATVMTDGLWITSLVETEGDILKTWELVQKKRDDRRDDLEQFFDTLPNRPNS